MAELEGRRYLERQREEEKGRAFRERHSNTFRYPEDRTRLSQNWAWGAKKVVEENRN